MNLAEYSSHDALGLARLVERREVSPRELAETALKAIEALNPKLQVLDLLIERFQHHLEADDHGLQVRVQLRRHGKCAEIVH